MKNQIAHIFTEVDMRCNHLGLTKLITKHKIKIGGQYVIFLNKARTMVKMFCKSPDVLLHYKKDGRVIDPGTLRYLPKYVNGSEIQMNKAVKEHLEDCFKRRS